MVTVAAMTTPSDYTIHVIGLPQTSDPTHPPSPQPPYPHPSASIRIPDAKGASLQGLYVVIVAQASGKA